VFSGKPVRLEKVQTDSGFIGNANDLKILQNHAQPQQQVADHDQQE